MWLIEIVNSCRALIAIIGFTLYLRFLLPRNVVPHVSAVLRETLALLDRAEAIGAIPLASEIRRALAGYECVHTCFNGTVTLRTDSCATDFLVIQMESHRSPGILQQLVLAVRLGLTYKMYDLSLRITAIRTEVQVRWHILVYPTTDDGGRLSLLWTWYSLHHLQPCRVSQRQRCLPWTVCI